MPGCPDSALEKSGSCTAPRKSGSEACLAADRSRAGCSTGAADSGRPSRSPWLELSCRDLRIFGCGEQAIDGFPRRWLCRRGVIRASLTSHGSRNYRCTCCVAIHAVARNFTPSLPSRTIMASRRACLDVLRRSEPISRSSSASSSLRNFSSQSRNWASAPRAVTTAKRRISPWSQQCSSTQEATSQILRHHRQFSSSPASRHGHLEPPRPGEECATNSHSHALVLTHSDEQ